MDLTKQYQYPPQFHPCNNPLAQKSNNKQNKQTNKKPNETVCRQNMYSLTSFQLTVECLYNVLLLTGLNNHTWGHS